MRIIVIMIRYVKFLLKFVMGHFGHVSNLRTNIGHDQWKTCVKIVAI